MLTVRAATAADGDAIGRIQVETWRAAYSGLMPADALETASVEERQRMWRAGLSQELPPQRATFVAEAEGEVVGFASVGECREPSSSRPRGHCATPGSRQRCSGSSRACERSASTRAEVVELGYRKRL